MKNNLIMNLEGLLLILVFLILVTLTHFACTPSNANTNNYMVEAETPLPDFELTDYEGYSIQASDLKGKYTVIHIATTWCPFCNAEAPNLEQLYQDYKDQNVEVLIIDVKEDRKLVKELLIDRFNLSFPILFDSDGGVAARFAPKDVLPDLTRDEVMLASNLLIDPEGNIRFFSLLDTQNFDAKLIKLKTVLDELLS